ncbi:carbohydrate ABC transporter membrane protein 1 (CUT1 family) [Paenibacillus taihuensis]|uniref:Carbohydrate ABC transporter membrane protein 1 (CUT1 family) n=1 Tax=Paenibacillus taihuensis TaxID=1156355 RepID=A0A3D9S0N8_9BACL|nr:sugar ABC transporter permease [Paenibacillus taihuensis]REE85343.1 carbohydrate ABC transporter membrane protein 1 (CUT1 family) [Paenibacillus taihuensis]
MASIRIRMTNKRRKALVGTAFISPWIIGFFIFALRPMIYSLYLSFQKVKVTPLGIKTNYVGWDNYKYAFVSDTTFVEKVLHYLREMALNVPIIVTFSLIIALLINQKIKMRGIFRTIFFLPVIITSGPVINELLSQGVTNIPNIESYSMFEMVKQSLTPAVANPIMYLFKQIIMVLWFSGVQILIFLAGLQKVDHSLYEAARIDGASPWEAFWKLTLPMLMPLVLVNFIYTIVYISTFALNEIIVMIKDNMFNTTTGFGYATAIAWIYFVLIAIVLAIWSLLLRTRKS